MNKSSTVQDSPLTKSIGAAAAQKSQNGFGTNSYFAYLLGRVPNG